MKISTIAKILLIWAVSFLLLTLLFSLWATSAQSQDGEWLPRRWKKNQRPYIYHRYYDNGQRSPRRYYRSIEEITASEAAPRCLGRLYSDKGRELSTEDGALKDAERSWGALIREERGEKWMDLKYAERYESRCQRSSTGESATAKALDTITGGNLGTLYRCRIWAEPCTAPKTQDGKDR